jgi:hypothetical protein
MSAKDGPETADWFLTDPGTGLPIASDDQHNRWTGMQQMTQTGHGYITEDSGERVQFDSGMVRDIEEDKPDYTLIDQAYLYRWAMLMVRGAKKYGRNNWRKANSEEELQRFKSSAYRHLMEWLAEDPADKEDHAAAIAFNIAGAEYVKNRLNQTRLVDPIVVEQWKRGMHAD